MLNTTKTNQAKPSAKFAYQIIDIFYGIVLFCFGLACVYILAIYTMPTVQASQIKKPVTCVVELVKRNETSQMEGHIK